MPEETGDEEVGVTSWRHFVTYEVMRRFWT